MDSIVFMTFTTFISNYSNLRRIMIIVELIGQLPNRIGSCIFNCLPVSFPFNMIQIVGHSVRLLDKVRLNNTNNEKNQAQKIQNISNIRKQQRRV